MGIVNPGMLEIYDEVDPVRLPVHVVNRTDESTEKLIEFVKYKRN